jgi:hypothetical protein
MGHGHQIMLAQVVWEPLEVDNLLIEMKLDRNGLEKAIRFAEHERSFVTANDPIGFGNFVVYAKAGRGLREWYLPKGWVKDDSDNQCAIKNSKTKVRIVPCNFDEFAGNRDGREPTNKAPKGEVSRKKSACNMTAWLPNLPVIEPELNDGFQTWVLGIHIDDRRPTGAELSLPIAFKGQHFTRFGKRIILLSGDDDVAVSRKRQGSDDDAIGIVDISVKRK